MPAEVAKARVRTADAWSALLLVVGGMMLMPVPAMGQGGGCVLCALPQAEAREMALSAHRVGVRAEERRDYAEAVASYRVACDEMLRLNQVPVMDACRRRGNTVFYGFGAVDHNFNTGRAILASACAVEWNPDIADYLWDWNVEQILENRERVEEAGQLEDWAQVCDRASNINRTSAVGLPEGTVNIELDESNFFAALVHGGVACALGLASGCEGAAFGAASLDLASPWRQMLGRACNLGEATACRRLSTAYREGWRVERDAALAELYEMREAELICAANPENERCGGGPIV